MSVTQINGGTQIQDATITPAKVTSGIIKAAGTNPFTGDQAMGGFKLTGLGTPINAGDAATKTYVDTAVTGLFDYKGNIDCSASPNYPAGLKGDVYRVSVAGLIGGAGPPGKTVSIGDFVTCLVDNAGGTEASVGTSWEVTEGNIPGITAVGLAILTQANPGAVRYIRVNADNTISQLTAAQLATAIGAIAGTLVTRETPSGTVNGSNTDFVLAHTPTSGTEQIYVNGILQDAGAGNDYTIATATITFLAGAIPQTGDKVRVTYWY